VGLIANPSLSDCSVDNDGDNQFLGHSNVRAILILFGFYFFSNSIIRIGVNEL